MYIRIAIREVAALAHSCLSKCFLTDLIFFFKLTLISLDNVYMKPSRWSPGVEYVDSISAET